MKDKKNKHLTLEDRNTIQQCLEHGMTFKAIAAQIGKDQKIGVGRQIGILPTGKNGDTSQK